MYTKFERLMTHDVTPVKITNGGYGEEREVLTTEKGFFEYGQKKVYTTENEEITAVALLFLRNDSSYDPTHDRWNFIDVKNDREMQLKQWEVVDDPRTGNTHHYELHLL